MNLEEVREYCLSLPGVTEDSPYGPDMIVFRIEERYFLHMPLEYADQRCFLSTTATRRGQHLSWKL